MASGSDCAVWRLALCFVANVRALSVVMRPSWRRAAGQGRAVWGSVLFGAWQKRLLRQELGARQVGAGGGPYHCWPDCAFAYPVGLPPIRCKRFGGYRRARRCPPGLPSGGLGREWGPPPRGAPWEAASPSGLLGAPFLQFAATKLRRFLGKCQREITQQRQCRTSLLGVMFPGHFVSPSCMTACTGRGGIGRGRG